MPIAYGILSGDAPYWQRLADLYRRAVQLGVHASDRLDIAVAAHGFIAADGAGAKDTFYRHEHAVMQRAAASRGAAVPDRSFFEQRYAPRGNGLRRRSRGGC